LLQQRGEVWFLDLVNRRAIASSIEDVTHIEFLSGLLQSRVIGIVVLLETIHILLLLLLCECESVRVKCEGKETHKE
jgi:hypothetical protein